jgi:N utilization substance protein A
VGDEIEVEVTPKDFGRIAAQTARQVLSQALRRIEKETVFDEFKDRIGEIVVGTVRRFERSDVVFELGKAEALMPNRERVPTEDYAIGERVRCFVKAVELTPRGPEVILSRADPQFVIKLFRTEVSEISDGTIEIKGIAREPGFRTKLAVYSRDTKVDPVGACVGIRGQRVKNIVRELNNEKVDIIEWSPDVRRFVENALAPAELLGFEVDEASHRVFARCTPDQLSLAIGRRGQNTRLTERLTGWRISIEADQQRVAGFATQVEHAVQELSVIPGVTPELALALVNAGIHSLEDLVSGAVGDLQELNEVGERAGDLLEAARAELARRKAAPNGTPPTH